MVFGVGLINGDIYIYPWLTPLPWHLIASCVKNICTKNYQNLVIGFQVTVENIGDVFLRHSVYVFNQNLSTGEVVVVPITAGIPQILPTSPWYYRGSCPHSYGNAAVIVFITAVITSVTAVLPPSPSSCRSLVSDL